MRDLSTATKLVPSSVTRVPGAKAWKSEEPAVGATRTRRPGIVIRHAHRSDVLQRRS